MLKSTNRLFLRMPCYAHDTRYWCWVFCVFFSQPVFEVRICLKPVLCWYSVTPWQNSRTEGKKKKKSGSSDIWYPYPLVLGYAYIKNLPKRKINKRKWCQWGGEGYDVPIQSVNIRIQKRKEKSDSPTQKYKINDQRYNAGPNENWPNLLNKIKVINMKGGIK